MREARSLTPEQLMGAKLCATALPDGIKSDPNRDCKQLPQVLAEQYGWLSLDEAKKRVDAAKQKWEEQNSPKSEE